LNLLRPRHSKFYVTKSFERTCISYFRRRLPNTSKIRAFLFGWSLHVFTTLPYRIIWWCEWGRQLYSKGNSWYHLIRLSLKYHFVWINISLTWEEIVFKWYSHACLHKYIFIGLFWICNAKRKKMTTKTSETFFSWMSRLLAFIHFPGKNYSYITWTGEW